jgi:glycosyltransferase involved in cell wall biosynthesis
MKNKIKVIVPFYNPGIFLDRCVNSLLTQDYENFEVLFIDDCSSDNSFSKIPAVKYKVGEDGNVLLDENKEPVIEYVHPMLKKTKCQNVLAWRSNERVTALPNLHNGIMQFCESPDDIVVILDGDDWLFNRNVLSFINDFYNTNNQCWLMYGSSKWTDGRPCCAREHNEEDWKNLRKAQFKVSHIRTFRAGLYYKIGEQDSEYNCMKDANGEYYKMTYDVAMFLPLLELAGKEHTFYNPIPLYVYNRENPISEDKVSQSLQWEVHAEILKKPQFKKIENYKTEQTEKIKQHD